MATLILRTPDGVELGRRSMSPDERVFYYRSCAEHDSIRFDDRWYRIETVGWLTRDEHLVLSVVVDPVNRLRCGCAVAGCTCD